MKKTSIQLSGKNIFLFFLAGIFPYLGFSQSPTRWRGPQQNGTYAETGLLKVWPQTGPEILWHYDALGEGYSAPSFANGRIFISGMEGTTGYVYSLSASGTFIWKAPYGEEWTVSYPGSRSTPVIVGDYLYILSAHGDLACLSAGTGKIRWKKNIIRDFDGRNIDWGYNETLVVHGDKLICTPGGVRNNMIALNRLDGSLIWSVTAKGEKSAYCNPLLTTVGSRNLLVTHMENNIIGVDADKGQFLWSYPHTNIYLIHPNTPLFNNNQVFCFSGYGQGGVMLQLNADGSAITRKWVIKTLDSRIGGAVYLNGFIYGSGDQNVEWQCIDWDTGKLVYSSKALGNGVVITAEGLLYIYSQRGELALVKPEQNEFRIISKTRVTLGRGQHWAHPVINDSQLFIRHGNVLIDYKIK